ncbi:MAG: (2Fe-2S)-binding protein [Phycisphaerales bacterium]|nr:(2Fe-2S)-binding protein [Phycisphaerales bacterium]
MTITIDDRTISAQPGQTVLEAAQAAGIYIPRLCHREGLTPGGACRVCVVLVNGRPQSACTLPVTPGMVVENDSPRMHEHRKRIIEMLFVEGNHFCMFCEKSGNCELQALAYRFGIAAPRYPYQFPRRSVDASHPDIFIDHNRCVLCARCIRASRDLDGKNVFQFVGRGVHKRVGVNARARLVDTDADVSDAAVEACPVGAILKKRVGYAVPVGMRLYDHAPIGADIEAEAKA